MKQSISLFLIVWIFSLLVIPAVAVDTSPEFSFELSCNDQTIVQTDSDEVLSVMLKLCHNGNTPANEIGGFQTEITYDGNYLEYIPENSITLPDIQTTDIALFEDKRALYVNYLSLSGTDTWEKDTVLGVFQFKVIGSEPDTCMIAEHSIVSPPDGRGSYPVSTQNLTIEMNEPE